MGELNMELNEYQELANRTAAKADLIRDRQACCAMGLTGEAGEAVDTVKKHLYHGKPLDRKHFVEELGDTLWYLAMLAKEFDITLQEVAIANVAKLAKRYPKGFKPGGGNR